MKRADLVALGQGAALGALIAIGVELVLVGASQGGGFPTTAATFPPSFVPSAPTPRAELPLTLAPDGLGLVAFGEKGDEAVATLTELLGQPSTDDRWTCADPAGEARFLQWADLGIFVLDGRFSAWVDGIYYPPEYGPLLGLRTSEGLELGIPLEELNEMYAGRLTLSEPVGETGTARRMEIDGIPGISGLVEGDGPEGRLIMLTAGTACSLDAP